MAKTDHKPLKPRDVTNDRDNQLVTVVGPKGKPFPRDGIKKGAR